MFCIFDRDTWDLKWNNPLINKVFNKIIEDVSNMKSNHEIHGNEIIEFEGDIIKKKGKGER